jgi:hypothetical protein
MINTDFIPATSQVSPISAVQSSAGTSPTITNDTMNSKIAQDNNKDDSLGVKVPDAETLLTENGKCLLFCL